MMYKIGTIITQLLLFVGVFGINSALAASSGALDLTTSWVGVASLVIFVVAYALVIAEEYTHMRKSKPVL